jgi:hypothetical protein
MNGFANSAHRISPPGRGPISIGRGGLAARRIRGFGPTEANEGRWL